MKHRTNIPVSLSLPGHTWWNKLEVHGAPQGLFVLQQRTEQMVFPQERCWKGSHSLGIPGSDKGLGGPLLTAEAKSPESFYNALTSGRLESLKIWGIRRFQGRFHWLRNGNFGEFRNSGTKIHLKWSLEGCCANVFQLVAFNKRDFRWALKLHQQFFPLVTL